jgi:hypothetical protein
LLLNSIPLFHLWSYFNISGIIKNFYNNAVLNML